MKVQTIVIILLIVDHVHWCIDANVHSSNRLTSWETSETKKRAQFWRSIRAKNIFLQFRLHSYPIKCTDSQDLQNAQVPIGLKNVVEPHRYNSEILMSLADRHVSHMGQIEHSNAWFIRAIFRHKLCFAKANKIEEATMRPFEWFLCGFADLHNLKS